MPKSVIPARINSIQRLMRKAMDNVIDSARTDRLTLSQTKINERIYLGTKVKLWLRGWLRMPPGRMLDLSIDGIEAGIQSTICRTWSVPRRIYSHPCILIRSDERLATCSIGLTVIRDEILNGGDESSGRRTISTAGLANVHWILKDEPFPKCRRVESGIDDGCGCPTTLWISQYVWSDEEFFS